MNGDQGHPRRARPTRCAVIVLAAVAVMLSMRTAESAETPTLEERAAAIERASTAPDGDRVVVGHISRTLSIPVEKLRTQRAQTGLGWGDLLIANRLSRETGLSLDQVVAEFQSGSRWEDIAHHHNVDVQRLDKDLDRSKELIEQRAEDRAPQSDLGSRLGQPSPARPTRIPGGGSGHGGH